MENIDDNEIECVVSKLFEDRRKGKIPTILVKELISPYIGQDRSEFDMLQEIMDAYSTNGEIGESEMKSVLVQWTDKVKSEVNAWLLNDITINNEVDVGQQGQYLSNSIASSTSKDYQEFIEELQNQVANKDHLINNYRNQVDLLSLQIQQQDEVHNALVLDRDKLREKLYAEHNQNNSLKATKLECDELTDALIALNKKLKKMEKQLDILKKENHTLTNSIAILDSEKQKLKMQLSDAKQHNSAITKSLNKNQCYIDTLKSECTTYSEKISEQEIYIEYLSHTKKSLETELHNAIDRTNFDKHPISLSSDINSIQYMEEYKLENINEDLNVTKTLNINKINTSTPCNNVSLMQEINDLHGISPINDQLRLLPRICITSSPSMLLKSYIDHTAESGVDTIISPNNSSYFINEISVNNFENMPTVILQSNDFHENTITTLMADIENLNLTIANMKSYQMLLETHHHKIKNMLKEASVKNQILQMLIKEKGIWINLKSKLIDDTKNDQKIIRPQKSKKINQSSTQRLITNCSNYVYRIFFWCALFCFVMAFVHLYNIFKYCNAVRRGTSVSVMPWAWITNSEFINSIFDLKYRDGPIIF